MDYRELNAKTMKDKFSIPVVNESLDELHGKKFFTKLDLRLSYHQIRMHPPEIEKHFELTMGISNFYSCLSA